MSQYFKSQIIAHDLKPKQLAEDANCSVSLISRIKNGTAPVTTDRGLSLAKAALIQGARLDITRLVPDFFKEAQQFMGKDLKPDS